MDTLYTLTEAAKLVHLAHVTLRKYCLAGTVGRRVGPLWMFTAEDIAAVRAMPLAAHKAGRPRES